jgi:hypothetical protein
MKMGKEGWTQIISDEALAQKREEQQQQQQQMSSLNLYGDEIAADRRYYSVQREKAQERERKELLMMKREAQKQTLARRKCERETVENYTQTPYRAKLGLTNGLDVMSTRYNELEREMEGARDVSADLVLDKVAASLRSNMIRPADLFDKVDADCDGCIDEKELREGM